MCTCRCDHALFCMAFLMHASYIIYSYTFFIRSFIDLDGDDDVGVVLIHKAVTLVADGHG